MELCRLDGIEMRYGREEVLRGVDLVIERGSIMGLIGENGSGKSTLLKILAAILRPNGGQLCVADGRPRIGYMPENCQWYPYLSGAQVLRYFARYSGIGEEVQAATLKRVGLEAARDKKVGAYSKGMKQKLGLAQAIIGDPDLLVLDEPTNGLDPRGIGEFYEILQERAERGAAIVLSSHLLAEIEGRITHAAFLRRGTIAASGPCGDLMRAAALQSRVVLRWSGGDELLGDKMLGDKMLGEKMLGEKMLGDKMRARGWETTEREDEVEVVLPREEVSSLLRLVADRTNELGDIEVQHASLDDLYVHMSAGRTIVVPNGKPATSVQREESKA